MRLLSLLAILPLAGCMTTVAPETPVPQPGPAPSEGKIAPGPSCDQTTFDPALILGRTPAEIGYGPIPFPVRVIAPGMAVTMDYSAARLNLTVDRDGRITGFSCG